MSARQGRIVASRGTPRLLLLILALFSWDSSPGAGEKPPVEVEQLLQTTTTWDGAPLPPYPAGQPEITILRITIAPGASLPWHRHPVINSGVLLSGELRVAHENGQVLHLAPGDAISEVVNTWHYGHNPGDVPAVILVVYAGAPGIPLAVLREDEPAATKNHGKLD